MSLVSRYEVAAATTAGASFIKVSTSDLKIKRNEKQIFSKISGRMLKLSFSFPFFLYPSVAYTIYPATFLSSSRTSKLASHILPFALVCIRPMAPVLSPAIGYYVLRSFDSR